MISDPVLARILVGVCLVLIKIVVLNMVEGLLK